jgi:hypothetical protein
MDLLAWFRDRHGYVDWQYFYCWVGVGLLMVVIGAAFGMQA